MSERDEFEAWVETVGDGVFAGRYLDLMWKAWQGARAPQGVPALTDDMVIQMLSEAWACIGNLPDGPTDHARHREIKVRIRAFLDAVASQRAAPISEAQQGIADENTGFEQHVTMLAAAPQPSPVPRRYQD